MRWAVSAMALVVAANVAVLVSAGRERAAPVTLTTIDVCAGHMIGGGTSDEAPAIRLVIAQDSLPVPGLDAPGLRLLGFGDAAIAAVGRERDSTFRSLRPQPAWVRLRQRTDSLAEWAVVEVAPLRDQLVPDAASIVVRGLVGLRERRSGPPPSPAAAHDHRPGGQVRDRGIIDAQVVELIPSQLHLDHGQVAALRGALADTRGCATKRQAVVAGGAKGGIWVESVR